MELKTFNGTGADCSGSSGDSNRILLLENTETTSENGLLVYVAGLALALDIGYEITHLTEHSQILFLDPLLDATTIVVNYYQNSAAGIGSDFINGPLADFGVIATRTPVTKTTDYSGDKVFSDGTDEDISIVISPYLLKYDLDKSGLNKSYDAIGFVRPDATINKYDKITYGSKIYRVDTVSPRDYSATGIFKRVMLYFNEDE